MIAMGGQRPGPIPARFRGKDQPYDCQACIAWHAETLHFPELAEENREAWDFYLRIQDQQRFGGMGEAMGLDLTVAESAARIYDVPDEERRDLFDKLLVINAAVMQHREHTREMERMKREAQAKFDQMEQRTRR